MAGRYDDQLQNHPPQNPETGAAAQDAGRRHLRSSAKERSRQTRAGNRKTGEISGRYQDHGQAARRTVHR